MKPSTSQLWLTLETKDKDGTLLKRIHKPSKSYVLQWGQLVMLALVPGSQTVTMTDIANATHTMKGGGGANCAFGAVSGIIMGAVGNDGQGILVGIGTTTPTSLDYKIKTLIANGAGAGELNYQGQSYTPTAIVGANVDFLLTRTFTNTSGNPIVVHEVALYGYLEDNTGNAQYFCFVHDLATITVNNGQTLTVSYTLRTTV